MAFWSGVDGHIHFEHPDFIGTERVRTSASGAVESGYNSEPYGEVIDTTGTDLSPSHYALLDQDVSVNSGLLHGMFREYSSTQGRWSSPDPYDGSYNAADLQSMNRYTYAVNNPLGFVDPSGLDSISYSGGCYWYNTPQEGGVDSNGTLTFHIGETSRPIACPSMNISGPLPWFISEYGGSYGAPGGRCIDSFGSTYPCPNAQPTNAASAPKAPQAPNTAMVGPDSQACTTKAATDVLKGAIYFDQVNWLAGKLTDALFGTSGGYPGVGTGLPSVPGKSTISAASSTASFVAGSEIAQAYVRQAIRSGGGTISMRRVGSLAGVFGKYAGAIGTALTAYSAYQDYQYCMGR